MRLKLFILIGLALAEAAHGQTNPPQPYVPDLTQYKFLKAPASSGLMLHKGDRLAICGDSITEQKMYSRIMEDYLTMCVPELEISVRQYGWSGERAPGFLARMTNDCLRFKPTVATTCYGMNDHEYRPYEDRIGSTYREKSIAIVEAFKANGARVIQGSPGCVGKMPGWVKSASGTVEDLNHNLYNLRNIGIEIAEQEKAGFADVFWPMLTAGAAAQAKYGNNYAIAGQDGVHPAWAGQTVMAFAFLKALGLNGDIGTFSVNLGQHRMECSAGHKVLANEGDEYQIESSRYPFCACVESAGSKAAYPACATDDLSKETSIRSAMTLIPFNWQLNRLVLKAKKGKGKSYRVTWGNETKSFPAERLGQGINLTEEFSANPFDEAFARVDAAVLAKQSYETEQIKRHFHSQEAKGDMEAVVASTEAVRKPLAEAIKGAFVPVKHAIKIVAE